MAGTDYVEWGMEIEEWELEELETPPHLLAEDQVEEQIFQNKVKGENNMSIEALTMAGLDYTVCGIEFEDWEQEELEQPPPYLLADPESGHEVDKEPTISSGSSRFLVNEQSVKPKMVESVHTIASINQIAFQFRRSNVVS